MAADLEGVVALIKQDSKHVHYCNEDGINAVFACCLSPKDDANKSLGILKELLTRGVSVNVQAQLSPGGPPQTALHYCALSNRETLATALVEAKAEINAKDGRGETALLKATQDRHEGVISMLLDNGADSTIPNDAGCTPLFMLAEAIPEQKDLPANDWSRDAALCSLFLSTGVLYPSQ
jgi:hypothetical protein